MDISSKTSDYRVSIYQKDSIGSNSHFHAKKNGRRRFCASKILTRPIPRHNSPLGVNTAKKTKTMHIPGAVDEIRPALEWSWLEHEYGTRNGRSSQCH